MKKFLIFIFLIAFVFKPAPAQKTKDIYEQFRTCACTKEEKTALLDNYLKSASPQDLNQLDIERLFSAMGNVKEVINDDPMIASFLMRNAIKNQNKQVLETFFDDWHWENTFHCIMLIKGLSQEFSSYILSKIKEYRLSEKYCISWLAEQNDKYELFETAYKKIIESSADYDLQEILEAASSNEDLKNFNLILSYEGDKIWQIPFLHSSIKAISFDNLKEIFDKIPKYERKHFLNLPNETGISLLSELIYYSKYSKDLHDKMEFLLKFAIDPNALDIEGFSPLAYAVKSDDEEAVRILLSYGADKNVNAGRSSKPLAFIASPKIQDILGKDQNILIMERIMKDKTKEIKNTEEYAKLWPKNVQVFIIGEVHKIKKYYNEVSEMLAIFRKKYENLVLATEFVNTSQQDAVDKYLQQPNIEAIKTALNKPYVSKIVKDIAANLKTDNNSRPNKPFLWYLYPEVLDSAKELQIKIVGLEKVKGNGIAFKKEALILVGMSQRNKNWIEKITEIIKNNKNVKILLYCGKAHSDYNGLGENSLPKLLDKEGISYKVLHLAGQSNCNDSQAVCNAGFEGKKTITKIPKKFVNSFGVDYILNIP